MQSKRNKIDQERIEIQKMNRELLDEEVKLVKNKIKDTSKEEVFGKDIIAINFLNTSV